MTLVSFDDDLDWEFVFDSRLGHPTGSSEEPMAKRSKKRSEELPILHPDAAGIDVCASELFVAVSADRDPQPVRSFPTFTRDLDALADWLQQSGVRSVAMESTSVYWIPIYQIIESRGLEMCLVNAQHVKNVPGRKTDVSDCQWLQYLHSGGLLRASFRPPGVICAIRSLWRHRNSLIQMAAARIVYHLLGTREAYNESVFHRCNAEAIKRAQYRLRKQAAQLGFQLIPLQNR
jgi:transposase